MWLQMHLLSRMRSLGGITIIFEFVEHFGSYIGDVCGAAGVECMTWNEFGVVVVYDHDVLVATGRYKGDFSCSAGIAEF